MDNVGSNFDKSNSINNLNFFKIFQIFSKGTRFAAIHPYEKLIAYESGSKIKQKFNFFINNFEKF